MANEQTWGVIVWNNTKNIFDGGENDIMVEFLAGSNI